jgi:arsenate reductase
MAEGWARHLLGDRFEAASAGSAPATVDPRAVQVMDEAGIDISTHRSKSLEEFKDAGIDHVFTLCGDARDRCPVWPGDATLEHHGFDDPPRLAAPDESADEALQHYRRVRDEIGAWIRTLPEQLEAHARGTRSHER